MGTVQAGRAGESGDFSGGGKNRLAIVQDFREGIPEIRHDFVRNGGAKTGPERDGTLSWNVEIRPKAVRKRPGKKDPAPVRLDKPHMRRGRVRLYPDRKRRWTKTQAFVSRLGNRAQNVANVTDISSAFRRQTEHLKRELPAAAHELKSDFLEQPHETKSEFPAEGGRAAHEIKSDFPEQPHETKSEPPAEGGRAAHEVKSDFSEQPHETKSEPPAEGGRTAHEIKSDFPERLHETRSESAAEGGRAAEFLPEGLYRAAGAG